MKKKRTTIEHNFTAVTILDKLGNKTPDRLKFPVLMYSDKFEVVVLFNDYKEGMVVASNLKHYEVGKYSKCWGMEHFKPCPVDFGIMLNNTVVKA